MSINIEYRDLSYRAYIKIKALILQNKLLPGQKIFQEKLAEELGVSRMPLHKAFQMLENELLVEHIPRRGIFVKEVNLYEIADAFECRAAIEGIAARRASTNLTNKDIKFLYSLFAPFAKNPAEADLTKYQEADATFHSILLEKSENKILQKMEMLSNILSQTYQRGLIRGPVETFQEHMDIIDALSKRDADKAEEMIKEHFRKSRNRILERISENENNGA